MQKAKVFMNGRSQAIRLPKEYRFSGNSVNVRKLGKAVVLFPDDESWDMLYEALEAFTPDFLAEGRVQPPEQEREDIFA